MTKKQHFVPRLYLKHFGIKDNKGKCFTYDKHSQKIVVKRIEEICFHRYLYEVQNEKKEFLNKSNDLENAFSIIESDQSVFLEHLLDKLDNINSDKFEFVDDERELLIGFISLMILRNKNLKDMMCDEACELFSFSDIKNERKDYLWRFLITNSIMPLSDDIKNGKITFYVSDSNSFITSDMPFIILGNPVHDFFYMPLSPMYAIKIDKPENAAVNLDHCFVKKITEDMLDEFNGMIMDVGTTVISSKKTILQKYI